MTHIHTHLYILLSHQAFCNYWVHNGFVNIDNEKMSKSLKNFKVSIGYIFVIKESPPLGGWDMLRHY